MAGAKKTAKKSKRRGPAVARLKAEVEGLAAWTDMTLGPMPDMGERQWYLTVIDELDLVYHCAPAKGAPARALKSPDATKKLEGWTRKELALRAWLEEAAPISIPPNPVFMGGAWEAWRTGYDPRQYAKECVAWWKREAKKPKKKGRK